MRAAPVVISLLVLLDGTLAQAESASKSLNSVFSGFLRYNLSWIRNTSTVVMENKTAQVQTGVCSQITSLVPWYQAQKNGSTCTVTIGEQRVHANYTILTTDDFLRKYDPSCVTYDILLANQIRLSPAFADQYYLSEIQLETRNPTQPAGLTGIGSTTIGVDGPLYKAAGLLRWDEVRNTDDVTKEVGENVRRQFVRFLLLDPNNGSYINTEGRRIYSEPNRTSPIRMEAQITFNNSMLVANGINYTCPPFKELVKASLDSRFFYSNTSYLWKQVNILDERSADTTTTSPASGQTSTSSDSVITVRTTTRGGEDEKSDGSSADTTTASPATEQTSTSGDSVTIVRTTTRGGVARITWRLASIIQILLYFNALLAML